LDAVNFTDGNSEANPTEGMPSDVFYIDSKKEDNKYNMAWELAAACDLQGILLPREQVYANLCGSEYNYSDKTIVSYKCTYRGPRFLTGDSTIGCDHTLNGALGCKAHFPPVDDIQPDLPFGGFPAVGMGRS
jgi:lambda family phage minor tail protein L